MASAEETHPSREQIQRFVDGELTGEESAVARHVALHLLKGCPECQKVARALWYRTEAPLARLVLVSEGVK